MSHMKNTNTGYLSDEELERLIAVTEAEPLLHPPKELKSDILGQIRRKRKYAKNMQLFSYSMKVFAATAAALTVLLIVPENIRPEDTLSAHMMQDERQAAGQTEWLGSGENYMYELNEKMNDYCSQLNSRLNQLIRMEDN